MATGHLGGRHSLQRLQYSVIHVPFRDRPDQMTDIKTAVIGGGLAGSAFAIEIARHGHGATVFEKTAGPHHKVCGEFLSSEAQDLLGELGLDVWKFGAAAVSYLGLEFGRHQLKTKLPFRAAGLSRFKLDQLLLDAAAQSGVQVIRGATVTKLQYERRPTWCIPRADPLRRATLRSQAASTMCAVCPARNRRTSRSKCN